MNCYGLPENERDYYRLAHRHRTVLNRLPYNQNGQMQDGCAPRWDSQAAGSRLVRLGPPVRPASGRLGVRRLAPQERAGRVFLPAAARELAQPDGRQLQRRLLGRPRLPRVVSPGVRRGRPADRRTPPSQALDRDALSGLPQQQEQLQGRTAGRAARLPGCWTSRPTSRTTGRCATSPGPFTKGSIRPGTRLAIIATSLTNAHPSSSSCAPAGLPGRHLPAAMAARQPRRPAGLSRGRQRDAELSAAGLRAQAGPGRNRPGVRLDQPGRGLERPAGGLVPGCLVAGGRRHHPLADGGDRGLVAAGRRAIAFLSGPRRVKPVGARNAVPTPDSLDPAQGLSARPAGRGVSRRSGRGCATSHDGRSVSRCARP